MISMPRSIRSSESRVHVVRTCSRRERTEGHRRGSLVVRALRASDTVRSSLEISASPHRERDQCYHTGSVHCGCASHRHRVSLSRIRSADSDYDSECLLAACVADGDRGWVAPIPIELCTPVLPLDVTDITSQIHGGMRSPRLQSFDGPVRGFQHPHARFDTPVWTFFADLWRREVDTHFS